MQALAPDARRKSPVVKIAVAIVALILASIAYFSFFSKHPAPETTFSSLTGEQVAVSSLKGKVTVVNFWATSCTTCVAEMPELVRTYEKYKGQGLEFVAVAMQYDPPNFVLNFAQTRQLPFTVAIDHTGQNAVAFGDVRMTPTTFVIDKKGNIIKRYLGQPDFASFHQVLEQALAA